MSKHIMVNPWVGSEYQEHNLFPYKTLILGESSYTSEKNFGCRLTINCVENHIRENSDPNFSRFAIKTRRVVLGQNTKVSAIDFWGNLAFYNFVQSRLRNAKERPTEKMWLQSVPAFIEMFEILKPERILVLGLGNWNNLLSNMDHTLISDHKAELLLGEGVIAGRIVHPSAGGGRFTYAESLPIAQDIVLKL